jgi:methylmalonyl-CoA mutase
MRIEEAAARRQAKIDSGADIIVGVNKYPPETEIPIEILEVDNSAVRATQIARLEKLRKERNNEDVEKALEAITKCAETKNGNLLELAIDAARKRASLGEISYAMEKVWGRHQEAIRLINNVYSSEYAKMDDIEQVRALTDKFAELEGRRPRILVAKMGQDGHDRGAKVVATAYADMGFDVDVGPLFQTPEETARQAVENDVHIIGISSLAGGHKTLLPKLMEELKKYGREDIIVTVGGVIPPQDYEFLYQNGAAAIFGPGTKLPESAKLVMEKLLAHKNE